MNERYNNVDTAHLYADGGWTPEQTPRIDPHAETQAIRAVNLADMAHTSHIPRIDQTQQMQTIEPLIPTRNEEDSEPRTGNRKAGRVPLALASVGLIGLAALGTVSVLTIENREKTEANAAETTTAPSSDPTTAEPSAPPTSEEPTSPQPTKVQAAKKSVSPTPSPSKSTTPPSPSTSPTATTPSASASATKTAEASPSNDICQWEMNGATVTVGECGDAIAYDEATGNESFPLTRGMAFDAQCIAGPRIQIVMANSVDYVNPGYFDTSSLPHC